MSPHLLTLPLELRNEIYTHLFASSTYTPDAPITPQNPPTLGLLLTNKQLHHETLTLYYKTTTITFTDPFRGMDFLSSIPRDSLQRIPCIIWDTLKMHKKPVGRGKGLVCQRPLAQDELVWLKGELLERGIELRLGVLQATAKGRFYEDVVVKEEEMVLEFGEGVRRVCRYFV